ncbi:MULTISPECIES: hypothetical protein [Calothrix]|uniref:Uncharacterized protein n=2 Tax=Calothrix TaxID=1186 RepID=A0ABR8ACV5_9CYAN|nr:MULTISPECIES: hypothetical protein [Calothrix]MBD2197733.1 hypothetical protein [Calothrix parietina FACHB-288]MBD2225662.1 hypothetical protein [Calothrix anomala FACHB-343]
MYQPVHPDDLPSERTIKLSEILFRQLEDKIKQLFYQNCVHSTRIVLSNCHWYFRINSGILMLILVCHNIEPYQNITSIIPQLTQQLKLFANKAMISVSPPIASEIPLVVNIENLLSEEDYPSS